MNLSRRPHIINRYIFGGFLLSFLPTLPNLTSLLLITLVSPHRKFECVTKFTHLVNH